MTKGRNVPLSAEECERAKVMAATGKTPCSIAKTLHRSHHTVGKFLQKPEVREQVGIQKEEYAKEFDRVGQWIVGAVTPEDVAKATLQQKMVSAGIAVDKAAMLRGEVPVTVNVTVLLDAVTAIREMREREDVARPQLTIQGNVQ